MNFIQRLFNQFKKKKAQINEDSERKKLLEDCSYGRSKGWIVEYKGKAIAELANPQYHDMFWVAYDVIVKDESRKVDLFNQDFWNDLSIRFLSIAMNEYVDSAIINTDAAEQDGVVIARGLYFQS